MKAIQLLLTTTIIVGIAIVKAESASLRHLQQQGPQIFANCSSDEIPCHDENNDVMTCAPKETGMCPCFLHERICTAPNGGQYCDIVCCEWGKQEKCHERNDNDGRWDVWCQDVSEGGCPCPDGEIRCEDDNYSQDVDNIAMWQRRPRSGHRLNPGGHCAPICCDSNVEQTCYDENYEPYYCALIEDGGCPCPEGQERCGGDDGWAGTCTEVCCDDDETTCYDDEGNKSCSTTGCSLTNGMKGYEYWQQSRLVSTIYQKGTGSQVSYYNQIMNRKKELTTMTTSSEVQHLVKQLEAEELALFHAIRIKEKNKFEQKKKKKKNEKEVTTSIS